MDVVKALRAQRGAAPAQKLTSRKLNTGSVEAFYTETGRELGKCVTSPTSKKERTRGNVGLG